jgi:hypothetical protein
MKHLRSGILCALCLLALTLTALAAPVALTVGGKAVDTSGLRQVYVHNGTVMVPFRKTAQALGYTVSWNGRLHCAQAEDSIQSVRVSDGSAAANWTGKLTVINLTRQTGLAEKAVIVQGVTYVPAALFEGFFNDVTTTGSTVDISPQMAYLDGTLQ